MKKDNRKIALIGTGMVGMSYAYALVNQGLCDELVLIDIDIERAEGEAMDLNHGLAFAPSRIRIYAGVYGDCADADIVVISAGANQKQGQTRTDLLHQNARIVKSVTKSVVDSGFNGIFLVASNPVDIMTMVVKNTSNFDTAKIIGSGTTLDTARLRFLIGDYFNVDPRSVHAFVMGEHGDSEFVPWSKAMISAVSVQDMCKFSCKGCGLDDLKDIEEDVRNAAYVIIKAKHATYYGIGMSLARVTRAIFADEHSVLTVSSYLNGQFGVKDLFVGVPSVIGRDGVKEILPLSLNEEELTKFKKSCKIIAELNEDVSSDIATV